MAGLQDKLHHLCFKPLSHCYFSLCLRPVPPSISTPCHTNSKLQVCFLTTLANHHPPDTSDLELTHKCATDSKKHTDNFNVEMKTFLAVLVLCYLCRAQKHSSGNNVLLQAPNVSIARKEWLTHRSPGPAKVQSDIWAELRNLRDMVVEQKVELRHLTTRVKAAEGQVEALQKENKGKL